MSEKKIKGKPRKGTKRRVNNNKQERLEGGGPTNTEYPAWDSYSPLDGDKQVLHLPRLSQADGNHSSFQKINRQ